MEDIQREILRAFGDVAGMLLDAGLIPENATVNVVAATLKSMVVAVLENPGQLQPSKDDLDLALCNRMFYFKMGVSSTCPSTTKHCDNLLDIENFNDILATAGSGYRLDDNNNKEYPGNADTEPDFVPLDIWRLR